MEHSSKDYFRAWSDIDFSLVVLAFRNSLTFGSRLYNRASHFSCSNLSHLWKSTHTHLTKLKYLYFGAVEGITSPIIRPRAIFHFIILNNFSLENSNSAQANVFEANCFINKKHSYAIFRTLLQSVRKKKFFSDLATSLPAFQTLLMKLIIRVNFERYRILNASLA